MAYTSPVKKLKRASFNGVPFPVTHVEVVGGIRDHVHEYPHADGGAPEKMGRKLYLIRMHADFQSTFRAYPDLWPSGLKKLRTYCEQQLTADLVVPQIGTIKAYARSWSQSLVPKSSMSGESGTFEFVEDQDSAALANANASVDVRTIDAKMKAYDASKALAAFQSDRDISIFDAISNAVNGVLAIGDQAGLAINLISAKLLVAIDLCNTASNTLTAQNAVNAPILAAMHDLWDTLVQSQANAFKKQARPMTYIVPSEMTIAMVGHAIYGTTNHTVELMQLNAIEDVFRILAGTRILYMASSTTSVVGKVDPVSVVTPGGLSNL